MRKKDESYGQYNLCDKLRHAVRRFRGTIMSKVEAHTKWSVSPFINRFRGNGVQFMLQQGERVTSYAMVTEKGHKRN